MIPRRFFVLLGLGCHRSVALSSDFDLQGAALVAPGPVRVRLLELAAGLERAGWIALLVFGIRLPIESRFRACTMLLGDVGEDRLRLRRLLRGIFEANTATVGPGADPRAVLVDRTHLGLAPQVDLIVADGRVMCL